MDPEMTTCQLPPCATAEYWENRYRNGDTPWDKGTSHPELIRRLKSLLNPPPKNVVVLGCGLGHDARAFLTHLRPKPNVVGLEISPTAVATASSLSIGEKYWIGSVLDPPTDLQSQFDLAFEHTCFCALSPECRKTYFSGLRKLLKSDALVWFILYVNPDHPTGPPFGCSYQEFAKFASSRFQIIEACPVVETFPGREKRELFCTLRAR